MDVKRLGLLRANKPSGISWANFARNLTFRNGDRQMTIAPLYRVQIFSENKWLTLSYFKTLEFAERISKFEIKHGRLCRVQKLRFNSSRRIYETI
jgi:hypothetical protein